MGLIVLRCAGADFHFENAVAFLREAQVRFLQVERKGDVPLPTKRLVATIAFDVAPGALPASALNVNPLGFLVTRYRVDPEVVP